MLLVENIVFALLLIFLSVAFHEFGHYNTAEKYKLKPSYKRFVVRTELDGSYYQQKKVIKSGIMLGLIPVIASIIITPYFSIIVFGVYIIGCRSDIKELNKIREEQKKWN